MIDGIFRIEEMRADECPDEFLTPFGNNNITMWRDRLADHQGKIYFSFPYISWCDAFYVDADEPMPVYVWETKKGLV